MKGKLINEGGSIGNDFAPFVNIKRSALLVVKIEYCYAFNITHSINQCFVCL